MKKLTFMFAMLLMAVVSFAQEVTLPEGVTAVDYQMTATTLKNYNRVDVNRTVKVAVDGIDVYMQGLAECLPEAWVKGILGGDEIVFGGSQLLGDNDGFNAMFEPDHDVITFAYDAAADKYTISAYELQAKSNTWEQYESVVITKANGGDEPGDDPIEPQGDFTISPEGVQQTSLSTFVITFNNYTVKSFMGEATATLTNTTTENIQTVAVEVSEDGKTATMNFEETTEPGKYTLQVVDLCTENFKFLDDELVFNYEIAGFEEPIEWTATPEAGEVEKIEVVTINFNKMLEVADGTQAYLFKGEEELQAKDITLTGGDKAVFVAFDEVTEAGEYQVVIPEGISTIAGEAVPEIAIDYTIAGSELQDDYTISPEGVQQTSLSTFVVTFNNFGVSTLGSEENATLKNNTTGVEQTAVMEISEDKKVVTMNFEETTEPGKYTLTLGDLWNASTYQMLDPITANYEIAGAVEQLTWTATPEAGEVEKIEIVTVSFNKMVEVADGTQAYLFKGEEELQAKDITLTGGDKAVFVAFDEVTEAGEYQVVIPEGINTLEGEAVPEIAINYTIVGEAPVLACEIDPAAGEVTSIKDFTLTFNGEVSLDAYEAQAVLTGGNLEEAVKAPMAISEDHKVVTFSFDEITEAGEYTLTIPEGAIFNRATFEDVAEMTFNYTIVGGSEEDVLVEVPEGVEQEDWHIEATYYTSQGGNDVNANNKVAFDGDDVYIQGLAYYFPEAWVKGKIVDGQAVFASGQYVGEDDYGKEYLNGASLDESSNFIFEDSYVFNYDAEAQKFTLVNTYLTECDTKDAISAWGYYAPDALSIIKGEAELPEAVVAPENLVTEDYIFKAQEMSFDDNNEPVYEDYEAEIKIGFDGNDVYVQGICSGWYLPEAWVKGVKDGSTVTFPTGQFFGTVYNQYNMYFVGYGESGIEDVVMTYDEATGEFTTDNWIFINGKQNELYYYTIYTSNVFTKMGGDITAIENVNAEESNAVYYDAMGRRTNSQAKGLLLKQVRMADGSVKTVKIARK